MVHRSSWNHFRVKISADLVMQMADAMVSSGLRDAGYRYINIDDGWAVARDDKNQTLIPDPTKWPHGMKAVADYVHSKGLLLGIYSARSNKTCAGASN